MHCWLLGYLVSKRMSQIVSTGPVRAKMVLDVIALMEIDMDEQKKQAIIDKLTFIINSMPDDSAYLAAPPPKIDQVVEDGILFLAGESYVAFDKLCDMLQSEKGWREKFSREYLEEEVIFPLLNSALISSDRMQLYHDLDAIVSECDSYAEEHTAYIPIDGINMGVDQLTLGKITLRNMKGTQFITFAQQVESEIERHESVQEKREKRLQRWHDYIQPLLKGKTVATCSTIAEPLRAQELAEQECAHVIDIFRYFIFVSKKKRSINIGLPGELGYGLSEVVVASSTYELTTRSEVRGPDLFDITAQTLLEMQQAGIYDLIDMYRAEKKTDFSDTLLTGIHWVANALMQVEPANEFLSLVNCLETFLTRDVGDAGSISNAIAVGVAWILGPDFAERQALRKEMKKLYDKRSSITHTGQQDDLADDLLLLRERVVLTPLDWTQNVSLLVHIGQT